MIGSAMQRLGYVPALDGVRGIAILLVIAFHYFGVAGGATGVDVFFVLSGFLISTLLLEERTAAGRVDLRAFYVRRARRLFPALAAVMLVYLAVTAAVGDDRIVAALAGISYVANILLASGSSVFRGSGLTHLWSLAEEEQFYVIWPALLILLARSRRALMLIVAGYLLLSAWRAGLWIHGAAVYRIYDGPDTRATALVAGAGLAVYRHRYGLRAGEWAGQLGACAVLFGVFFGWAVNFWPTLGQPTFEIGIVLLIAAALSETSIARGLATRPLVWVGKRSYSLYLWQFVGAACVYLFGAGIPATIAGIALAFICADLSYRFVETPFRRRRSEEAGQQHPGNEATLTAVA
jgi:peptidoglycan/LPS O-acetylase OafA/YrhL